MALLFSGTSIDGLIITPVVPDTTKTYTLYLPEGDNQMVKFIGGIYVVQLDQPIPGVNRQEQYERVYTWSTRYVPVRGSASRRLGLHFRAQGIMYEVHG